MSEPTKSFCIACGTELRPQARFCDQCGAAVSSAGAATQRLPAGQSAIDEKPLGILLLEVARRLVRTSRSSAAEGGDGHQPALPPPLVSDVRGDTPADAIPVGEWGNCDHYTVRVYRALRGMADDGNPSFALEVEYECRGSEPLQLSEHNWLIYDADGYQYTSALYNGMLLGEDSRRLRDNLLQPGERARGWIGFKCPLAAPLTVARFRYSRWEQAMLYLALPSAEVRNFKHYSGR